MPLEDAIIRYKPEASGSVAADRFDYQRNWAICKLLELHKKQSDYVLVIEYHDDISVVDSASDPKNIAFYQVKTLKNGTYSVSKLIRRDKLKANLKGSILGKLYRHKLDFKEKVKSLNVISNARYKVALKTDGDKSQKKETICCNDLHESELKRIASALRNEHELTEDPVFATVTYLLVSDIPLEHHSEVAHTKLCRFIEEQFPNIKYQGLLVYRSIFDEVRLIGNRQVECTTLEELIYKKAIDRKRFTEMLSIVTKPYELEELGASIENRLNSERTTGPRVRSFRTQWREVIVNEMNPSNTHRKLKTAIRGIIKGLTAEEETQSLWECATLILSRLKATGMPAIYGSDEYLHSLILREYWDGK